MSDKITIEMDKEMLNDLILTADMSLFDAIRNDPEIDNIRWVATRIKVIDMLMKANGEEGLL